MDSPTPFTKKSDYLLGIKYWALWFPYGRKPQYEIFVYAGSQPDTGMHMFYARKNPKVYLTKNVHQLNCNGFHAFVIDLKRVEDYCKERGWEPPNAVS